MRKQLVTHLKRRGPRMIVDNFAGGGGASTGIEMALGRSPDVAINHDGEALAMHFANHPWTRHYQSSVWDADPRVVCRNQRVGLAWFSPDCTDFSKAKGGTPVRKEIRGLAWVVLKWAVKVRPEVIILENVEEFQDWGPVRPKCGDDGRQLRDPQGRLLWTPCPDRRGNTFAKFVRRLRARGYTVDWRELRANHYGAPTIRKRLFLIARCDGKPIRWPKPTHGPANSPEVLSGQLLPERTAAEIIDWSLPCPSIFLTPEEARAAHCKRPLRENTLKRIAKGLQRYVLENPQPFIVYGNHGGDWFRGRGVNEPAATVTASRDAVGVVNPLLSGYYGAKSANDSRCQSADQPLRTQTTENRFGVVAPFIACPAHSTTTGRGPNVWDPQEPLRTTTASNDKVVVAAHLQQQFGNSVGRSIDEPCGTVMPGGMGKAALCSAFLAQHNTGVVGHEATVPLSTITQRGTQQQVVAASLVGCGGRAAQSPPRSLKRPVQTLTGKADACLATAILSEPSTLNPQPSANHVAQVLAFLQKYYSCGGQDQDCRDPLHTLTAKARMGLVTVDQVEYQIVDIGMRMLSARELFRAQGFPPDYRIEVWCDQRRRKGNDGQWKALPPGNLTKESQVRMCGNSVCPQVAAAIVAANCAHLKVKRPGNNRPRQRELQGV